MKCMKFISLMLITFTSILVAQDTGFIYYDDSSSSDIDSLTEPYGYQSVMDNREKSYEKPDMRYNFDKPSASDIDSLNTPQYGYEPVMDDRERSYKRPDMRYNSDEPSARDIDSLNIEPYDYESLMDYRDTPSERPGMRFDFDESITGDIDSIDTPLDDYQSLMDHKRKPYARKRRSIRHRRFIGQRRWYGRRKFIRKNQRQRNGFRKINSQRKRVCSKGSNCRHKLEPMGCFKDIKSERAMTEEILNERDTASKVFNNRLINWRQYHEWLPGFICRCAQAASERGYSVIGIQFWGECWSGPNSESTYNKHGQSDSCVNKNLQENRANLTQCAQAAGKDSTNYVYRIAPACNTKYEPVGCFQDDQKEPRPIPHYISTDRDSSLDIFSGKLLNWKQWNTHMPDMICRCAALAKSKGHKMFAIQFWGECWSGPLSNDYKRNGASGECRGKDFKECSCNSYYCVGKTHTNYVYRLS